MKILFSSLLISLMILMPLSSSALVIGTRFVCDPDQSVTQLVCCSDGENRSWMLGTHCPSGLDEQTCTSWDLVQISTGKDVRRTGKDAVPVPVSSGPTFGEFCNFLPSPH